MQPVADPGSFDVQPVDVPPEAGAQAAVPTTPAPPRIERPRLHPLLGFAALVIGVAGLQAFGELLGPLFVAIVLVVTVAPISTALRRRRFPGWLAMLATLVAAYAVVLALAGSLFYAVSEFARVLPGYGPRFAVLIADGGALLQRFGVGPEQIRTAVAQFDIGSAVGFLQGLLGSLTGFLSAAVLVLSVLLFMTIDAATFPARLLAVGRSRPGVVTALTEFSHGTRRFLAVATIFGLVVAAADVAVLWVLGVPLALLFGLISLIANYIPNVGFLIALVPPALLALLEGGPQLMLAVIIPFLIINVVVQTIVQPRFVGDAVGLSVTVTFLALVFWGWVIGPLGALLAIPLTLLAKALLVDADPRLRWMNALISDRGDP